MSKKSEFADVRFRVSEFGDGEPYLSTQENGPNTNSILNGTTSFLMTLQKGTTIAEAEKLADHLNQHVAKISLQFQGS
jgi:hypothetical protein